MRWSNRRIRSMWKMLPKNRKLLSRIITMIVVVDGFRYVRASMRVCKVVHRNGGITLNTARQSYFRLLIRGSKKRGKWWTRLRPLQSRFLQAETNLPYNCSLYCKTRENSWCCYCLNLERRFHRVYADVLAYSDATRGGKKKEEERRRRDAGRKRRRRRKDRRLHI